MKKITLILFLVIFGLAQTSYAQGIPGAIKEEIISLAKEGDKQAKVSPDDVKASLLDFLSQAPPPMVPTVLELMRNNSSSAEFHQVLDDIAENGDFEGTGEEESEQKTTTVFTNVNLIDGSGGKARSNTTIVFTGDKITNIVKKEPKEYPEDAVVVDLKGKYVMPGLIDAHVHMATDPSSDGYDYVQGAFKSMLGSGIVAVRDMGGDGRALAFYARQVVANDILGPDLYYSSILAGPNFFSDPRPASSSVGVELGTAPWAYAVTDDTDLAALMQRVKGTGATGVKLYYDIDAELTKNIADAAKDAGLKVWSHWVVSPADGTETVKAGVEVLSHAQFFEMDGLKESELQGALDKHGEDSLYKLMKAKQAILDSTLAVMYEFGESEVKLPALITKNAHKAGVEIAAGSDVPNSADGLPGGHVEFRLLASESGMTPAQVLKSAAVINAKVLGKQHEVGVIEEGKKATFLIYSKNPMRSIESWSEPLYVVKNGVIYSGEELRDTSAKVKPVSSF